jgi:hypothetical protein
VETANFTDPTPGGGEALVSRLSWVRASGLADMRGPVQGASSTCDGDEVVTIACRPLGIKAFAVLVGGSLRSMVRLGVCSSAISTPTTPNTTRASVSPTQLGSTTSSAAHTADKGAVAHTG